MERYIYIHSNSKESRRALEKPAATNRTLPNPTGSLVLLCEEALTLRVPHRQLLAIALPTTSPRHGIIPPITNPTKARLETT